MKRQTTISSNIDATTNNDNDCDDNEYQNTMSKKIEFWQDFKFTFEKTKQPLKIQIDFEIYHNQ